MAASTQYAICGTAKAAANTASTVASSAVRPRRSDRADSASVSG